MSQMPEIKGVINKEPERDKKKAGLLARLFGGGGSGGSGLGGIGGFGGGAGGGMGGLAGGGILATKAGLIALLLAGTTVAGGIGMLGYRLFGPGADSAASGDNLQLFSPKPKDAPSADGQGAAKDGTSASLQYLNQANKTPTAADAGANGAIKDATAANAVGGSASDAAAAGGAGAANKIGDTGNGVAKGTAMLKNKAAFGTLTGPGGGAGGGGAASSAPKSSGDLAGSKGSLGGFKKAGAAAVSGGSAHALAGRHIMGAAQQGFAVLSNQKGAGSSAAAGQTYDGAAGGGSNIGGAGTPIGGAGSTTGAGAAQPTSLNAPANPSNNPNIPTPAGQPLCPWQNAIKTAQMLLALGGVLLFVMSMLHSGPQSVVKMIIGSIVAMIGTMIIGIGAQVATGQYGQKLQGGVLAAAGAGLTAAAIWAMMSDDKKKDSTSHENTTTTTGPEKTDPVTGVKTQSVDIAKTTSGGASTGFLSSINPYVLLGGGAVLIGIAGTMMAPPTTYPPSTFGGHPPPDLHMWGYQELPSETALKTMVA